MSACVSVCALEDTQVATLFEVHVYSFSFISRCIKPCMVSDTHL